MWGISILADFRPMGISFHTVAVFGLGKNLLFKSVLGHCETGVVITHNNNSVNEIHIKHIPLLLQCEYSHMEQWYLGFFCFS